jgi:hypothetical protein
MSDELGEIWCNETVKAVQKGLPEGNKCKMKRKANERASDGLRYDNGEEKRIEGLPRGLSSLDVK